MKTLFLAAALFVSTTSFADAAPSTDTVAIVNKANPTGAMSRDDLRPIFQTTKMQWSDGSRITAYDLPDGDPTRDGFDAVVRGLDPDRVNRYWVDRKIRGGERPPMRMPAAAVLRAVASNKGAIGYIKQSELTADVKVIARIHNGQVYAP